MKEQEQGKERYLEKGGGRRAGEPLKVVMKGRKEKRKRQRRKGMCVCLLNLCVELCVYCVILSPVTRVGEGWTGLI